MKLNARISADAPQCLPSRAAESKERRAGGTKTGMIQF
jgi:hypothetical protein